LRFEPHEELSAKTITEMTAEVYSATKAGLFAFSDSFDETRKSG